MLVQQKAAWFNLTVFTAAVVTYGALAAVIGPTRAMAASGLCGLWGLSGLYCRRRPGAVVLDERDRLINLRAQLAGLWVFWELFVAGCMIIWALRRYYWREATISIDALPLLVIGGLIVFVVTHSIAVLVQYGRSHGDE